MKVRREHVLSFRAGLELSLETLLIGPSLMETLRKRGFVAVGRLK